MMAEIGLMPYENHIRLFVHKESCLCVRACGKTGSFTALATWMTPDISSVSIKAIELFPMQRQLLDWTHMATANAAGTSFGLLGMSELKCCTSASCRVTPLLQVCRPRKMSMVISMCLLMQTAHTLILASMAIMYSHYSWTSLWGWINSLIAGSLFAFSSSWPSLMWETLISLMVGGCLVLAPAVNLSYHWRMIPHFTPAGKSILFKSCLFFFISYHDDNCIGSLVLWGMISISRSVLPDALGLLLSLINGVSSSYLNFLRSIISAICYYLKDRRFFQRIIISDGAFCLTYGLE